MANKRAYFTDPNYWMETDDATGEVLGIRSLVGRFINLLGGNTAKSRAAHAAEHAAMGITQSVQSTLGARKWFGSTVNGVTVNQTTGLSALNYGTRLKITAEAAFDAMAVVWINRAGNAVNNCTALVGVTETGAADTNDNVSQVVIGGTAYKQLAPAGTVQGWRSVTWAGAASVSLASAASATQVAISDFIPISSVPRADGGTLPLALISAQHDGSVDGNFEFAGSVFDTVPSAANRGRIIQNAVIVGAVSSPALSGSLTTSSFNVFPIFRYRVPSLTVLIGGDSITQNDSVTPDNLSSWGWRGCCDASTQSKPINYVNVGCSGKGAAEYWARAKELIAAGLPVDVLVMSPMSINDNYAATLDRSFESGRAMALDIIAFARTYKIPRVVLVGLPPNNVLTLAQDNYRKDFNVNFLPSVCTRSVSLLQFSGLGDGASPERFISGMFGMSGYQVAWFAFTRLPVSVTSYVGATTYTATITVNGTACAISFLGSAASTFADLISVLNAQINTGMGTSGVTYASLFNGNIAVVSNTIGSSSTVAITAGTAFASPLATYGGLRAALAGLNDGAHPSEAGIEQMAANLKQLLSTF